jgi:plastocyanin
MNPHRTARTAGRGMGLLLLAAATLALGCSEHVDPMGPDGTEGPVVEIEIRNFEFSMPELHIAPGTTVRWRNTTSNYHTVTPDGHSAWTQWQTAGVGETFEVRFDAVGSYPYYCMPHRALGMMGTIIVE